jgi:hypothetical protein
MVGLRGHVTTFVELDQLRALRDWTAFVLGPIVDPFPYFLWIAQRLDGRWTSLILTDDEARRELGVAPAGNLYVVLAFERVADARHFELNHGAVAGQA